MMSINQSLEHNTCCGCTACLSKCPLKCISMVEDVQGFLRPQVDNQKCIDCGQCEKVCPALHLFEERMPLKVWAAKNNDEAARVSSSSGGIFMALAKWTIDHGGVVFGARFDEKWEVIHDYAETLKAAEAFMGSKYLQSRMGNCYTKAKEFLEANRLVLFTGTQCQIAGLKHYLKKEHDKLIAVDVICHGVPSPLVWRNYLQYTLQKNISSTNSVQSSQNGPLTIEGISFRDKSKSWEKFGLVFHFRQSKESMGNLSWSDVKAEKQASFSTYENLYEDLYIRGFLANIYLRPSCYCCPAKGGKSQSDMTIGDYWGLPKELRSWNDDRGISLILVFSEKAISILKDLDVELRETTYKKGLVANKNIAFSVAKPKVTDTFWKIYPEQKEQAIQICLNIMKPKGVYRFILKFYWLYQKIIKRWK